MAEQAVRLSSGMFSDAVKYASVFSRSVSSQIEHWARIGKIAEENPDLPYDFIRDTLIALEEVARKPLEEYHFG
jgi:hypothetical protein